MMAHHEPCSAHEIFVGNTTRDGGSFALLGKSLTSVRLGKTAYDIDGKPLPNYYAPLFIQRCESDRHHAIMMDRTFGINWRRS